jgi:23S rRNA G2069 N7-methylase RlmK/C1962 C5-methylase RlmI
VETEEFFGAVQAAAGGSGRRFEVMDRTGHPPDHPARIPEAQYLKGIYLHFDPTES